MIATFAFFSVFVGKFGRSLRKLISKLYIFRHLSFDIGHWALGIGHWALGMGHWALGIGHWAWGIGYSPYTSHTPFRCPNQYPILTPNAFQDRVLFPIQDVGRWETFLRQLPKIKSRLDLFER
ncbi:hypothetical protein BLD44_026445 [Mastigocladus laminosus UU774]|nr:hypothetical protein BLD44_026445 [Mastigocladus laminosus UU774]